MATVRIASDLHPDGRLYEFRPVSALNERELGYLRALFPKARRAARVPVHRCSRVAKMVDRAVRVIAPDIEPEVLRALPATKRADILITWAAEQ